MATPNPDSNPNGFPSAPKSEQARLNRTARVKLAVERAWYYFCTQGDPHNGYRIPRHAAAVNSALHVGVSTEIVESYFDECSGTGWDNPPEDGPPLPFVQEIVIVNSSPTIYFRPRDLEELKARRRKIEKARKASLSESDKAQKAPRKAKGGGNA